MMDRHLPDSGKHGRVSLELGTVSESSVMHAALLDLPDSLLQQHLFPLLASADKKMLRCAILAVSMLDGLRRLLQAFWGTSTGAGSS